MPYVITRRSALLSGAVAIAAGTGTVAGPAGPATAAARPAGVARISAVVSRLTFTSDGALLAGVNAQGVLRFWSLATGRQSGADIVAHDGLANDVAAHPVNAWVATGGSDGVVRIWDTASRKVIATSRNAAFSNVGSLAFSPLGNVLGYGLDAVALQWNLRTGARSGPLTHNPGFRAGVLGLAYSPDGKKLAGACANNVVQGWAAATGVRSGVPMHHDGAATSVAFSPDGRTIASADGGGRFGVRLWAAATGSDARTLLGHTAAVTSVVYRSDGRLLASGSADATVRLWNPLTGAATWRLLNGSSVADVALSPNGKILAVATGTSVNIWNVAGV